MSNTRPRISIIIATYNVEHLVDTAIKSVLQQDYDNKELVLVDGASKDGTAAKIREYESPDVIVSSEPDEGIYDAWNKALRHATGDFVMFIGADDRLAHPKVLSEFWAAVSKATDMSKTDMAYSHLVTLGVDGAPMDKLGAEWRNPWSFGGRHLWCDLRIPIMSTLFRRRTLLEHGGFDISLRIIADIDLVLKIARKSQPVFVPGVETTLMGYGGVSTRPDQAFRLLQESVRVRRYHGLGTTTNVAFNIFVVKQVTKYSVRKLLGKDAAKTMMGTFHAIKKASLPYR